MKEITDPSDVTDPAMQRLLRQRFDQLADYDLPLTELGRWYLVQPGDVLPMEDGEPFWEWVLDHDGFYEAVVILSDDGFGHAYLIPNTDGIDPELLTLCRRDATKASDR